ncbi:MAG: hypothetical protein ACRC0F_00915 [Cetobacterium sp.]
MGIIKEMFNLFIGSFLAIILPTILLGWGSWCVSSIFGTTSIQMFLWIGFAWWMSLNYIVVSLKKK